MPCPANELGAIAQLGAASEETGFCTAMLRPAFLTLPFRLDFARTRTKFKGAGETPAVRNANSSRLGCTMAQACCLRVRERRAVPYERNCKGEKNASASEPSIGDRAAAFRWRRLKPTLLKGKCAGETPAVRKCPRGVSARLSGPICRVICGPCYDLWFVTQPVRLHANPNARNAGLHRG